jgi:indolepyruvate ferredoxin oxidoreductase alpha subunit
LGIIGVGVGATLAYTLQRRLKISRVKILKLLVTNPLPQHQILKFAKSVEKILVLEDGDPIVESKIKNLLFTYGINRKIMGKESGDIKKVGELTPGSFLFLRSLKVGRNYSFTPKEMAGFCAGCPHRASFYVIKEVRKIWEKRYGNRIIIIGDRGCYNQGAKPPFNCMDVCMNMGSSIGISYGLSKSGIGNPIIAIIGDSTFFHSGIPPLLNSLFEGGKICVVVLDNECTAMTGGQPNPSSRISSTGEKRSKIFIEELLRGLNIKYIDVINPFEIEKAKKSLLNALMSKEMSIIIFRQTCAEQERKLLKTDEVRYEINNSKCKKCKKCINEIGCPAIRVEGNNIFIDPSVCTGCGLCVSICPFSAIRRI